MNCLECGEPMEARMHPDDEGQGQTVQFICRKCTSKAYHRSHRV